MGKSKNVTFKDTSTSDSNNHPDELYESVKEIKDKWKILPYYLGMRGIARQHINSYDNFVLREIKDIMRAPSNKVIRTELDPNFFIEFVDIRVGRPCIEENMIPIMLTPQMCRIRDLTYSAPIYVDVDYVRGQEYIRKNNLEIGRIPVMLRSCICALSENLGLKSSSSGSEGPLDSYYSKAMARNLDMPEGLNEHDKALFYESSRLKECPYDPGGYFIIKGVEKVILMQEQLSKSRIIVEMDNKKNICATVTSATAESKSRTAVTYKNSQLYVKHNSLTDDVPLCIILKAMGVETDQEIAQLISNSSEKNPNKDDAISGTPNFNNTDDYVIFLNDLYKENINSRLDAILFTGKKIRPRIIAKGFYTSNKERPPKTTQMMIEETHDLLCRVLLSHIPMRDSTDFSGKIKTLSLMAHRVLNVVNNVEPLDDKDHYGNKRLELAGQMISILFEDLYKKFLFHLKKQIEQTLERYIASKTNSHRDSAIPYPDILRNLPTDILTRGMTTAISTGNWNIKRFRMERSGVSQVLSRLSYISSIGMMTRTNSQFEKGRKVSGPRALQPSQFGLICPCDTPEGESCGLVKNLSLMTHVTSDVPSSILETLLFTLGVEPIDTVSSYDLFHSLNSGTTDAKEEDVRLVLLNGVLLGIHKNVKLLVNGIIKLRRKGLINMFVSVYENYQQKQIHISSDGGRLCRPLIVVQNSKPKLTDEILQQLLLNKINIDYLFNNGILEWIDVNEENNLLIVMREKDINHMTTHLEISPMSILGVVAGLIPFPNHNQSPRNTYQCAMGKQSIGSIGYNQLHRCDTIVHLMNYTQVPLVTTKTIQLVNFDKLPAGQNAIVAVMSYQGYEIEDAIILNRASIDRGFSRCFTLKNISCEITSTPPNDSSGYHNSGREAYKDKDPNANKEYVIGVGERVIPGQVLISTRDNRDFASSYGNVNSDKYDKSGSAGKEDRAKYMSFKYNLNASGHIDRIILTESSNGNRLYKVIVRQSRPPEIGDKFSSRHGQKGVVGLIAEPEDMPFTESGMVPDLVMNPHGFPSRMTVGKLLELVASKSSVLSGRFVDSTPFSNSYSNNQYSGGSDEGTESGGHDNLGNDNLDNINEICNILIKKGFHPKGKEVLYSGITGNLINTLIFFGPIYYQRLKHMVMDKIHARSRGPRQMLTRQPTEGRSKDGGLRLGEMERDCLIAYGASNLLIERLMLSSDVYNIQVCNHCGFMGYNNYCKFCQNRSLVQVTIPYACKLLFQELQAMNIKPSLIVKNS